MQADVPSATEPADASICQICRKSDPHNPMIPMALVRPAVVDEIRKEHPNLSMEGSICKEDLDRYRIRYVESLLRSERGDLTSLDQDVVNSLEQNEFLTSNLYEDFGQRLSLGETLADRIAGFGGSWTFILIFGTVLLVWIGINTIVLVHRSFDPYPFILLNLILSCLAAIQAPVIMMSQNRQEAKDRLRAEHDYRINLKSELEIRYLHEKIDHLLSRQWERLAEIQEIQIELMAEVTTLRTKEDRGPDD